MATCRLCNKSGWFMSVSDRGLCRECEPVWLMDVEQRGRIVGDSARIINESKNVSTRLSRIDVAIDSFRALQKYEARGIETLETPPSRGIARLTSLRQEIIGEHVREELTEARSKSRNATTPAGRTSPFAKVIEKVTEFYKQAEDTAALAKLEREAREEMDRARLAVEIEKAERAAFKGQKKRAIDAYLDALFILKRDSIDDADQRTEIEDIRHKIQELGGEVPEDFS